MVAVTGLMTTDTLYFHFTVLFELDFGAVFQAVRTCLFLKQNHYSIGTFSEKSFAGSYVSDSLHLTLAMNIYSCCRQQIQKYSVNETDAFLV
jgi:hypothetical protein